MMINFNFNIHKINYNNNNIKYSLENLPDVSNSEPSDPIMKNIDSFLDGLVQERNQKIELSSELNKFFPKTLEIFLNEKTSEAENKIQISAKIVRKPVKM